MTESGRPECCNDVVQLLDGVELHLGDAVVELQLTGAPKGLGRITMTFENGRLVSCAPGAADAAVLKLKATHADAVAVLQGDLDPSVAFMRGDLKTDGPTGILLELLAAFGKPVETGAH